MSSVISKDGHVNGPSTASAARRSLQSLATIAPVTWWASFGVVCFVFSFYIWAVWLSGSPVATLPPTNLDPAEQFRQTAFIWTERIGSLMMVWALYHFTFRPLIRERRLTNEGIAMAAMPLIWFQEPIGHWATPWWSYSTYFTNIGNWAGHIPGAMSQNIGVIPEPIPFSMACYPVILGLPVFGIVWGMRWIKSRYPTATVAQLLAGAFVFGLIYDFVFEHGPARLQVWSFQRVVSEWSLFAGTYYQYPIYEGIFFGGMAAAMASMLYFTDDKGRTFVEKGIDRFQLSAPKRAFLRFFAVLGFFELLFLIYNVNVGLISMHADPMPADMPAHLMTGLCGDGTDYVCADPGKGLPVIISREQLKALAE